MERTKVREWWLLALFLAIVIEGALRKWMLPANLHPAAYLAKDCIAVLIIVACRSSLRQSEGYPFKLLAWTTLGLLTYAFVLGTIGSWQSAVITLKNAVLWPALAATLSRGTPQAGVSRLLKVIILSAVIMTAIGVAQNSSAPGSWINRLAWTDTIMTAATMGGGGVRATGTFSFISGLTRYSVFVFAMLLWLFWIKQREVHSAWLLTGIGSAVACGIMSGSRSAVVMMAISLLLGTLVTKKLSEVCRVWGVVGGVCLVSLALMDTKTIDGYLWRWTSNPEETAGRFTDKGLSANYLELLRQKPWGVGLGQRTGYASFEAMGTGETSAGGYDHGLSNAALEAGLPGLVAALMAIATLAWVTFKGTRSRIPERRIGAAVIGGTAVISALSGIWHDHVGSAFVWLSLGLWLGTAANAVRERRQCASR